MWSASILLKKNAFIAFADKVEQYAFLLETALLSFVKALAQIVTVRRRAGHNALLLHVMQVSPM